MKIISILLATVGLVVSSPHHARHGGYSEQIEVHHQGHGHGGGSNSYSSMQSGHSHHSSGGHSSSGHVSGGLSSIDTVIGHTGHMSGGVHQHHGSHGLTGGIHGEQIVREHLSGIGTSGYGIDTMGQASHSVHGIHGVHGTHGVLETHGVHGSHGVHGAHGVLETHGVHGSHGIHGSHGTISGGSIGTSHITQGSIGTHGVHGHGGSIGTVGYDNVDIIGTSHLGGGHLIGGNSGVIQETSLHQVSHGTGLVGGNSGLIQTSGGLIGTVGEATSYTDIDSLVDSQSGHHGSQGIGVGGLHTIVGTGVTHGVTGNIGHSSGGMHGQTQLVGVAQHHSASHNAQSSSSHSESHSEHSSSHHSGHRESSAGLVGTSHSHGSHGIQRINTAGHVHGLGHSY